MQENFVMTSAYALPPVPTDSAEWGGGGGAGGGGGGGGGAGVEGRLSKRRNTVQDMQVAFVLGS